MEKLLINTPQNVNIEYGLASIGTRIFAFALDYAIIIGYVFFVWEIVLKNIEYGSMDLWLFYGLYSLLLLPVFFYSLISETALNGQTIGKKVLKIKVVKVDGTRATIYEYFMRWSMTIVDIWMLSGVIGLVSAILTKKTQRIGDIAAGTTVIGLKPKEKLIETVFEDLNDDYLPTYPQVRKLSDRDINIIKRSFNDALKKKDPTVIRKLANKIKEVTGIELTDTSEQDFIQTILKDHYEMYRDRK